MTKGGNAGRLPEYYRLARELLWQDIRRTSSTELSKLLGVSPSTVRKDIEDFDGCSRSGYGIDVRALFVAVSGALGFGHIRTAVIFSEEPEQDPGIPPMDGIGVFVTGKAGPGALAEALGTLRPEILVISRGTGRAAAREAAAEAARFGVLGVLDMSLSEIRDIGCPVVNCDPRDAMMTLLSEINRSERRS